MYDALGIARYVVNYADERNMNITNLKLQKILYYIQAGFLAKDKGACFSEPIMCWRHGPVVKSVYNEFSRYTDQPIPYQKEYKKLAVVDGKLAITTSKTDSNYLKDCDKKFIDGIVESFLPYDAWSLVERTHQESPWKTLECYNVEITKESIQKYFKENPERIYGQFDQ